MFPLIYEQLESLLSWFVYSTAPYMFSLSSLFKIVMKYSLSCFYILRQKLKLSVSNLGRGPRLDYQPLFGKEARAP